MSTSYLKLALLAVIEKPPGSKSPNKWLVMLSIDLATFCDAYIKHKWAYLEVFDF